MTKLAEEKADEWPNILTCPYCGKGWARYSNEYAGDFPASCPACKDKVALEARIRVVLEKHATAFADGWYIADQGKILNEALVDIMEASYEKE